MEHIFIVIVVVLLIFFFTGIFALYFYKCFLENILQTRQRERSSSPTEIVAVTPVEDCNPGLDPKILNKFPTCVYSAVKQYRKPDHALECSICLLEFADDHVLRLITICSHVFHQECIDIWFVMHKTCPACRRNLELPGGYTKRDSVRITIKDDDHEEKKGKFNGERSESFTRSRDTYEDRFRLRLPDHMIEELMKANYWPKNLTKSGSFGRKAYISGQGSDGNV